MRINPDIAARHSAGGQRQEVDHAPAPNRTLDGPDGLIEERKGKSCRV